MCNHMMIGCTGKKEHQYQSPLHVRYYTGNWFNIPRLSRVIGPTISFSGVSRIYVV